MSAPPKKIFKSGPFEVPRITPEYPDYSRLLSSAIKKIPQLPDFSEDRWISVMSDFGGEHKEARFHTYTFLIFASNKGGFFEERVAELRQRYKLVEPYSEFKYKKLYGGARKRALSEFLELADTCIHGALITLAIDKKVESVFGPKRSKAHAYIEKELKALGLGTWPGAVGEKALRICHAISMLLSVMTHEGQDLFWYCDLDAINDGGKGVRMKNLGQMFGHTLEMYCPHGFNKLGYGRSFDEKSGFDDYLSVADLATGTIQDLLTAHIQQSDISGSEEEKILLIKWIAKPADHLAKITIQIGHAPDGTLGSGLTEILPRD